MIDRSRRCLRSLGDINQNFLSAIKITLPLDGYWSLDRYSWYTMLLFLVNNDVEIMGDTNSNVIIVFTFWSVDIIISDVFLKNTFNF